MTFEDFDQLSIEDKSALFESLVKSQRLVGDLEAERDSFKTENEALKKNNTEMSEELKKTKEMNFTLARKVSTESPRESAEDILHSMFK